MRTLGFLLASSVTPENLTAVLHLQIKRILTLSLVTQMTLTVTYLDEQLTLDMSTPPILCSSGTGASYQNMTTHDIKQNHLSRPPKLDYEPLNFLCLFCFVFIWLPWRSVVNCLKARSVGTEGMPPSVKCPPCKQEVPSSDPQHPHEMRETAGQTVSGGTCLDEEIHHQLHGRWT